MDKQLLDELKIVLQSLQTTIACHSRDWSLEKRDAWVWGVLLGWDDEDGESKYSERPYGLRDCPKEDYERMQKYRDILRKVKQLSI